jgi:hypothetical protein
MIIAGEKGNRRSSFDAKKTGLALPREREVSIEPFASPYAGKIALG